jgi:hypothetical protein
MDLFRKAMTGSMGCVIIAGLNSCVETFVAEMETVESALVIDATITDEVKVQEITLGRSFAIEAGGPHAESNASVSIIDSQGGTYAFNEASPGIYHSETAFAAQQGHNYQLFVTTSQGSSYTSEPVLLTPKAEFEELYAVRTTNDGGQEGVAIRVNSSGVSGGARNYRYEYAETYNIIAPDWTPDDLIADPEEACGVLVGTIESDEQICYTTDMSNTIILTETNGFDEDRVKGFTVRFINRNNYIISHRYSVLVRQLVQSEAAYTFFETLNEFSGSESLLSETQPGFLEGNVFSTEDESEKVLGYFDVATVTERRIFFNYDDFFPGEALPPYADPCNVSAPVLTRGVPPVCVLSSIVKNNGARFVAENGAPATGEGPYLIVPRVCGDCTALGTIEVPPFWVEN